MDTHHLRKHNRFTAFICGSLLFLSLLKSVGSASLQLESPWTVAALLALTVVFPLLGTRWFAPLENALSRLAARRTACLFLLFFLTIAIRLALLPIVPYPRPTIHDEYGYLLQADIFAHGRLAFPSHPMSLFFETFYINFHPTYSAMYPPAQSAVLAIGQLASNPWIGVLLSTAAMVSAILWMLQGWFPARWALLGASLVLVRFAIFSYWMNSYWGGSVAAIGAALVLGALPRVQRHQRPRDAFLLGFGVFILANSRPFEGAFFCIPVAVVLLFWLLRLRRNHHPLPFRTVVLPITAWLFATLAFTLYYDWRLTGDPLLMPRALYYRQYFTVSPFIWGKILPAIHYSNPQFEAYFNGWLRHQFDGSFADLRRIEWDRFHTLFTFFIGGLFAIPFLSLPWILRSRRLRPVLFQLLFCIFGLIIISWFMPHYAAPAFPVFVVILVQAFRYLRRFKFPGRPVGIGWTRVLVLCALFMIPSCILDNLASPGDRMCLSLVYDWQRAKIVSQLNSTPGDHLIIVQYSPGHRPHRDWVFNSADIDHSKIVWAREIPGVSLAPLLAYYPQRQVWSVDPDAVPPVLSPYSPAP